MWFADQLISRRPQRRDLSAQFLGNVSRAMRPGANLGHCAQIFLLDRSKTVESHQPIYNLFIN